MTYCIKVIIITTAVSIYIHTTVLEIEVIYIYHIYNNRRSSMSFNSSLIYYWYLVRPHAIIRVIFIKL